MNVNAGQDKGEILKKCKKIGDMDRPIVTDTSNFLRYLYRYPIQISDWCIPNWNCYFVSVANIQKFLVSVAVDC